MYDSFDAADTAIVAVSQEDEDLARYAGFLGKLAPGPRFPIVADLKRAETKAWDRTTAYLIDKQGIVREIFPMIIHARPSWKIIAQELERLK